MKKTTRLKKLILDKEILVMPGAQDALSAKIIETVGFKAVTIGGYAASAASLAKPDVSLLTLTEYVGIVGGQYYYLGPGNVWIVCDPVRLHRFQGYMHDHPDWHNHMTHNVKYRNMPHGHPAPTPMHDQGGHYQPNHDHDHNGPPQ